MYVLCYTDFRIIDVMTNIIVSLPLLDLQVVLFDPSLTIYSMSHKYVIL